MSVFNRIYITSKRYYAEVVDLSLYSYDDTQIVVSSHKRHYPFTDN